MKTALLFGASGFVGSFLLRDLLDSPDYAGVTAVVRKETGLIHPKLKTLIGDYASLPALKGGLACDEVFIALGTTKKKTPDQGAYYMIDHDYPVLAASMARDEGASSVFFVSSVGASTGSGAFYLRTKGETERDIITLDFAHTHIFRPSLIMGERPEHRPVERLFMSLWSALDPLFMGGLKKYRGMEAQNIARAIIAAAAKPAGKVAFYGWSDMRALLSV